MINNSTESHLGLLQQLNKQRALLDLVKHFKLRRIVEKVVGVIATKVMRYLSCSNNNSRQSHCKVTESNMVIIHLYIMTNKSSTSHTTHQRQFKTPNSHKH